MHVFFEFLDTFVMIWRKKNLLDKTKWDLCWCGFGNELKLLLLLIMHFWRIVARKRERALFSIYIRVVRHTTDRWSLPVQPPMWFLVKTMKYVKKNHWYRSGILFTTLPIYLHSILHSTYRSRKNLISWPGSKESFRHILHKRRQKGVSFEFSL